jgi:hypothetical protein
MVSIKCLLEGSHGHTLPRIGFGRAISGYTRRSKLNNVSRREEENDNDKSDADLLQ